MADQEHPSITPELQAAIKEAQRSFEVIMQKVQPGQFVQVERVLGKECLWIEAHRCLDPRHIFERKVKQAFDDACESLKPGQKVVLKITR